MGVKVVSPVFDSETGHDIIRTSYLTPSILPSPSERGLIPESEEYLGFACAFLGSISFNGNIT